MKNANNYPSLDAIRNDDALNIVERARVLEQWANAHVNDPPPPPPPPNPDERRQLLELKASLSSARKDWLALESQQAKYEQWLPTASDRLRKLERETEPDATNESVDELNRLSRRIQLARQFEGNASSVRTSICNTVAAAFHPLNRLVSKFDNNKFPRQFFLAGVSPVPVINDALETIERLLKP
jgi:hypothetical protein